MPEERVFSVVSHATQTTVASRRHAHCFVEAGASRVVEVLDAWLAPKYRDFKLRGADGDTFLVRP